MTKTKKLVLAVSFMLMCGTAAAHRHPHYHGPRYRFVPGITTVIKTAPGPRATIVSRLTKNDRYEMAVAYLTTHPSMSVKQYAKMTGLKKDMAEAELNVYATDVLNPIKPVPGKKNVYFLKK